MFLLYLINLNHIESVFKMTISDHVVEFHLASITLYNYHAKRNITYVELKLLYILCRKTYSMIILKSNSKVKRCLQNVSKNGFVYTQCLIFKQQNHSYHPVSTSTYPPCVFVEVNGHAQYSKHPMNMRCVSFLLIIDRF